MPFQSRRGTNSTILKLYGVDAKPSENQLEMGLKECPYCGHENSPNARFCSECNTPLDSIAAERSDAKRKEREELAGGIYEEWFSELEDQMPEALDILENVLRKRKWEIKNLA